MLFHATSFQHRRHSCIFRTDNADSWQVLTGYKRKRKAKALKLSNGTPKATFYESVSSGKTTSVQYLTWWRRVITEPLRGKTMEFDKVAVYWSPTNVFIMQLCLVLIRLQATKTRMIYRRDLEGSRTVLMSAVPKECVETAAFSRVQWKKTLELAEKIILIGYKTSYSNAMLLLSYFLPR